MLFLYIEIKLFQLVIIIVQKYLLVIIVVFYEPNKYTVHAEQDCISKVKNKTILKKATLYIVKIDKLGNFIDCYPCHMCSRIIDKYKVKKIICCV